MWRPLAAARVRILFRLLYMTTPYGVPAAANKMLCQSCVKFLPHHFMLKRKHSGAGAHLLCLLSGDAPSTVEPIAVQGPPSRLWSTRRVYLLCWSGFYLGFRVYTV